jgi:hypothetical protein
VGVEYRRIEKSIVICFREVRFEKKRQPNRVICMRYLVDILQFGAFIERNAVWHGAALFLL